jgi:hypothetical protein
MKVFRPVIALFMIITLSSCQNDSGQLAHTFEYYFELKVPENFDPKTEPRLFVELVDDWGIASTPFRMLKMEEGSNVLTKSFLVSRRDSKFVVSMENQPSQVFEIACPTNGRTSADWTDWHIASWFDETPHISMVITKQREQNRNTEFNPEDSFWIRYRFEKWTSPTASE